MCSEYFRGLEEQGRGRVGSEANHVTFLKRLFCFVLNLHLRGDDGPLFFN